MKRWSVIVACVLALAACSKPQPLNLALLLKSDLPDDDYYRLVARGVSRQLKLSADPNSKLSIDYLVTEENDVALGVQILDLQREKWQRLMAADVQAILFTPEAEEPLADLLMQARDRGIKTVSLAGPLAGVDASVGRGFDPQPLDQLLGPQLEGQLVIAGGPDIPQYRQASQAISDYLKRAQPALGSVAENYDFGPVLWRSRAFTFNFLVIAPQMSLFFALDDHIGRASMSAIMDRDKGQQVRLVSFGGSPALLEQARSYPLFAGLAQLDPQRIGATGALLAYQLVHRPEKVEEAHLALPTPLVPLDQAVAWDYPFPEEGFSLP